MEWKNVKNKLFFLIKRIGSEILRQFSLYLKFSFYFFLMLLTFILTAEQISMEDCTVHQPHTLFVCFLTWNSSNSRTYWVNCF